MHCPEVIELEQYLTGELDAASCESITCHLSACDSCASRLSEVEGNLGVAGAVGSALAARSGSAASLATPAVVGSYRIVREIGRGGMGIVYEAEQQETRRAVALKVLHPYLGVGDHHEKLFRREVRVLGRLRHSGIAAIYEAGRTPEGRSYFVMELVNGRPLNEYVREADLSIDERLRLLCDACRAVAYAHQRGVIHRDLKPSNILVEADGTVKVLDFGLATVLERDGSSSLSVVSEVGRVFGTVPFMSPEQVRGRVHEIDVRSDVYSLGVVLYLVLAGRLPYELDAGNLPQATTAICETAPTRPSVVSPSLRGDLETILLKALAKEPERRYATVAALADDIERYRNDEPITARPPSFTYQFRKLVRRHRLPFALAATVVLLVLGFGATAGVLAVRLRDERNTARLQRAQAEAVNQFLQDMLAAVDPTVRPDGPDVTLREVLDEAAEKIEEGLEHHPTVEVALRTTIGNAYRAIGRYEEARAHLKRAVDLGDGVYPDGHADLSLALNKLARLSQEEGAYEDAERLFRRALAMRRKLYGEKHEDVAVILNNLGSLLYSRRRIPEAERLLRQALDMRRELLGEEHTAVANSMNNLALVLQYQGKREEAVSLYRRSLAMDRALRGAKHPHVAITMGNLAATLKEVGQLDEAESLHRESVSLSRMIYGGDHPSLAVSLNNLALLLSNRGKTDEAESLYRESLAMDRRLRGEGHPNLATTMANLAELLIEKNEFDEAEHLHRQALEVRQRVFGMDHPQTLLSRYHLGGVELARGNLAAAEARLAGVVAVARNALAPRHWYVGIFLTRHAECLVQMERTGDAEAVWREAYEVLAAALGTAHERTLHAVDALIALYDSAGRAEEAEMWRQRRNGRSEGVVASAPDGGDPGGPD